MINAVEHLFKCLLNIHVSSLGQCPVVHSLSSVRPMDCRIPGFLVLHYLPEFAETTVQWGDDAVQPSYPLSLLFSSCPQYFPIRVFSSELLLASGSQSIGASGSASVLPITIQGRFPLGLTGLISLQHDGLAIVFAKTTVQKATVLWCSTFFMVHLSHPDRSTGETIAWITATFVSKVMYMFFKTLCRFVLAFLPRSKCLLISWLQSPFLLFPHLFAIKWWDRMPWS